MAAYMKDVQPFRGVARPERSALFRAAWKTHPVTTRKDWEAVVRTLWSGEFREERYQALDVAEKARRFHTPDAWPLFDELVKSADHWDTLDWIAGRLVSPLLLAHRELESHLVAWSTHERFWVRRAALLAHLKHREATNTALLADTIRILAPESEFFIRKAIGWVLREYAKHDPDWVNAFVAELGPGLSPLSRREALKHL